MHGLRTSISGIPVRLQQPYEHLRTPKGEVFELFMAVGFIPSRVCV